MLKKLDITFLITAYVIVLLFGSFLFTPSIFVNKYSAGPRIYMQVALCVGIFIFIIFKKKNIILPPNKYTFIILLWFLYHLIRNNWNFESFINYLTLINAFFLFYWFWNEMHDSYEKLFLVFLGIGFLFCIWGIGQYMGWITKNSSKFSMIGPFNNPAGISASLVIIYPFSLYFCINFRGSKKWIALIISFLISLTIVLSGARAAIVSMIVCLITFIIHLVKRKNIFKLSFLHYSLISIVAAFLFVGMYFIKKDSADGRILIWKCSSQLVKQVPLFGYGKNGFKAHYMTEQANFFSRYPNSKFAMLADNNDYPFNEYIKAIVEYGFIGFIITALLLFYPFNLVRKNNSIDLFICKLSLLAIGICAFFSYPLVYPYILLMLAALISYLIICSKASVTLAFSKSYFKISATAYLILSLLAVGYQFYCEKEWNLIAKKSLAGGTRNMLPQYLFLYEKTYMSQNNLFLYNYAAELNHIGKNKESNKVLETCINYLNDYDVQMLMADNYEKLQLNKLAERHYKIAHNMIPVKFMPLYSLAKFYESTDQYPEALKLADVIINKKVKIPSPDITQMKREMKQLKQEKAKERLAP